MLQAVTVLALLLVSGEVKSQTIYQKSDKRPDCPCGSGINAVSTRVVGGHDAGNGNFPYASCLIRGEDEELVRRDGVQPVCGATLITDSHVITAAHCVKYVTNPNQILVDISDYDLQADAFHLRRAKTITRYPKYNPNALHYDIALIEFERPVKWKSKVRAVMLPPPNLRLDPGVTVSVYGWGRVEYEGHYSHVLQSLEMPVVESGKCQKKFWTSIEKNMLCAGGVEGHDACIGDSGSGLVVRLGNVDVLCGLVSFGRRCALRNIPGVYTRVSSYVGWIYEHTKSSLCKPCFYSGNDAPVEYPINGTSENSSVAGNDKEYDVNNANNDVISSGVADIYDVNSLVNSNVSSSIKVDKVLAGKVVAQRIFEDYGLLFGTRKRQF